MKENEKIALELQPFNKHFLDEKYFKLTNHSDINLL